MWKLCKCYEYVCMISFFKCKIEGSQIFVNQRVMKSQRKPPRPFSSPPLLFFFSSDFAGIVSLRFNCSDQMTYQTTAQIFMGLAQAWWPWETEEREISEMRWTKISMKPWSSNRMQPVYFHSVLHFCFNFCRGWCVGLLRRVQSHLHRGERERRRFRIDREICRNVSKVWRHVD